MDEPNEQPIAIKIPSNLEDCFIELERLLSPEQVLAIKEGKFPDTEEFFGFWLHHQLGQWLRNNWGLWHGSQLRDWFNEHDIWHADDMSGIILDSFKRRLNGEAIKLDEQINHYQEFWKNSGVDVKADALKARES